MSFLRRMMTDSNFWDNLAVQTLDSDKPNYNPAASIVFNNNGKGLVIANPIVEGGGRYFLTKIQAAEITTISTMFMDKVSVVDSNAIVSSDTTLSYNFSSLNELQYFIGLTKLNSYDFRQCTNLTSIIIPNKITILGTRCFFGCASLTTVVLPDTLVSIGADAFRNCTNLLLEELPESVSDPGTGTFEACSKISLTQLPSGITLLPDECFTDCTNLALTSLPIGLTSIGNYEFRNTKITITEIPATVTNIGGRAFQGCSLISYLHMLSNTPCTIPTGTSDPFRGSSFKLYVGDGSSAEHDNAILQTYLANTNWATLSSRLDTWWNYLQTQ